MYQQIKGAVTAQARWCVGRWQNRHDFTRLHAKEIRRDDHYILSVKTQRMARAGGYTWLAMRKSVKDGRFSTTSAMHEHAPRGLQFEFGDTRIRAVEKLLNGL